MNIFKSWRSYYQFERAVIGKNRYIFDSDIKNFLQTVLETAKSRTEELKKDSTYWRSQLGHIMAPYYEDDEYIDDIPYPFLPKRMKPLTDSAAEGRANPKGIPYLYLSTDMNTAMSEARPWTGSYISIGPFKLLKDIKIVNCTSSDKGNFYLDEPEPKEREIAVWRDIDKAFSKPITTSESTAEYAPTQIIAELFKSKGFDGIAYRSSLGKGHNIVLFNLDDADLINRTLFEVKKLSFDFSQASTTFFGTK